MCPSGARWINANYQPCFVLWLHFGSWHIEMKTTRNSASELRGIAWPTTSSGPKLPVAAWKARCIPLSASTAALHIRVTVDRVSDAPGAAWKGINMRLLNEDEASCSRCNKSQGVMVDTWELCICRACGSEHLTDITTGGVWHPRWAEEGEE
jgi:hypothetical protein